MKIKFKTLSNTQFEIEVDPSLTIMELKTRIEAEGPDIGPASALKLIYKGRILEDATVVQACDFHVGNFIVVMVGKAKPAATTTAAPLQQPHAQNLEQATSDVIAESEEPSALAFGGSSPSVEQIEMLCAMGFDREDVMSCLHAAYDNADRAVEYLTNGIPPNARPPGSIQNDESSSRASRAIHSGMHHAPFPAIPTAVSHAPDVERQAEVMAAMEELHSLPNFSEIQAMLQENPASLQQILPTLAQEKPELYEIISANREAFAELLVGGPSNWEVGRRLRGREGGGFRLTPAELEAVGRLQQLGFSRAIVIEAFVACDKNEEITANYLFEHGPESGGD